MTPEQILLVRASFAQVKALGDQAAALFYERLFALDPTLRALFKGDLAAQRRKLLAALAMVVARSTGWTSCCRRCASSAAATPATASCPSTTRPSAAP